ncbi:MAG: tRNA pseudouridine(38-40) synthase TruA [Acidobacteria bacterium]|nr:tRNA pseudouridine(38-40) synthase TruA [Acidobacteriota bacterium]
MSQNYRATIQYDGSRFCGWQKQKSHPTVQADLERAIQKITSERTLVIGSGRTDSGVHAEGQVANFVLDHTIHPSKLLRAVNAVLPHAIRVVHLSKVGADFHAQFSAKQKIYWYRLWNAPVMHPFWRNFALHVPQKLDLDAMHRAAHHLVGDHNFRAFAAASTTATTLERKIAFSRFTRSGALTVYQVAADGFLHHMVRNIVGTLLLIGKGKLAAAAMRQILQSRDRQQAGPRAPAHGLTLKRVIY